MKKIWTFFQRQVANKNQKMPNITFIEIQIKTTMKYHLISVRMAIKKRQ